MTSSRPYLVRAMYQWIVDNGMTPHLLVDAVRDGTQVPESFIEDGRIVLNVAPMAVTGLTLGDEIITFSARFGGQPNAISIPVDGVMAIYARENGQGMMFNDNDQADTDLMSEDASSDDPDNDPHDPDPVPPRPKLRVIK